MTDGLWTVDRPEVRVDPIPIPPFAVRGVHEYRGRESPSKTSTSSGSHDWDNKRAQAHSDRCRIRIEEGLRTTPHGAERLDKRAEVINEALAEEVRREEQKRRRSDISAAEVTEAESLRQQHQDQEKARSTRFDSAEKIDRESAVDDSQVGADRREKGE